VPFASWKERCDIFEGRMGKRVTVYFIGKDIYFNRPELYRTAHADYQDNAERFTFFSRAIVELCHELDFIPEIVHCNDWQTGLVPLYLRTLHGENTPLGHAKSVFTVHNLGYQGLFWHWDMRFIGLGWDTFTPEGLEFWGKINFLKAGLVYSDIITTVSKTYSREIQTPEYGHGLDGVLAKRSANLYGIVNGIDYTDWDPARDASIARKFSTTRPNGKTVCKQDILKRTGLSPSDAPLIGMVTRLTEQKGLDVLADAIPEIMAMGMRMIILGTGEETYHLILTDAATRYQDQMRVLLRYDDELAKGIYAGCDMFLMPSRYEPCGLGQMIALRYGTVPVVRNTGGLADTVINYNTNTGLGTGFVFDDYSAEALVDCLLRAREIFRDNRKWKRLMLAGMTQDFSWESSAKEYVKVYRKALRKK
jgi:starch synthase